MAKIKLGKRPLAYLLLSINTLTWGAALVIVKPAFAATTPFRFLFYRYLFASFFSIPILFYYWSKIKHSLRQFLKIIALELVGTVLALTFLYLGLERTSAIEASLLANTTPIFIIIAGILFLKEKEEKHEWLGLIFTLAGTLILSAVPLLNHATGVQQLSVTGNLLVIGHNISTTLYFIFAKKHYKKLPKFFVTTISFYLGTICFFILSFLESGLTTTNLFNNILQDTSHYSVWIASLYMAIFGSIIGLTAYIKGQDNIEASEASLFWYLQPLVYLPLAYFWLGETLSYWQIAAMIIILVGVILAEKRFKLRKIKKR
ncbi:MAG: DMT family transporter [Candidatus Woesebacteria bacterium]